MKVKMLYTSRVLGYKKNNDKIIPVCMTICPVFIFVKKIKKKYQFYVFRKTCNEISFFIFTSMILYSRVCREYNERNKNTTYVWTC